MCVVCDGSGVVTRERIGVRLEDYLKVSGPCLYCAKGWLIHFEVMPPLETLVSEEWLNAQDG